MTTAVLAGASAPAAGRAVTEPGIHPMTAAEYHADPVPGGSLSSTGARRLLPPGCPALFAHERDHGRAPSSVLDLGHAAHRLVLGDGPTIHVVEADNWRTMAAREERDQARADGLVPLLAAEYDQVAAMADALRAHPVASALFDPARGGAPEQALFWRDPPTGVWRRALLDWLPPSAPGRMIMADYKTTTSAAPEAIRKAVDTYGYHQQAAWYTAGIKSLGLAEDVAFVFVFQEKTTPYLVTVVQLDAMAMRIGAARNRRALQLYAECTASGRWPGYADDIEHLSLPAWAEARDSEEYL
ncbi:PD-(D/E)XK nuclease-like domain-containing protein [Streptomyces diacarni]|uniref:PD-(D/E)XK nuclease-like domain-containing protein n=1 Tax=Streptomyces diacarni TaxID=2800381 RepID=UPI0033E2F0A0